MKCKGICYRFAAKKPVSGYRYAEGIQIMTSGIQNMTFKELHTLVQALTTTTGRQQRIKFFV